MKAQHEKVRKVAQRLWRIPRFGVRKAWKLSLKSRVVEWLGICFREGSVSRKNERAGPLATLILSGSLVLIQTTSYASLQNEAATAGGAKRKYPSDTCLTPTQHPP